MSFQNKPYSSNYNPVLPTIWEEDEVPNIPLPLPLPRTRRSSFPPLPPIRTTTQSYPPLPPNILESEEEPATIGEILQERPSNVENYFDQPAASEIIANRQGITSRRSLHDVLQGVKINKPWEATSGSAKYGLSYHPKVKNLLDYIGNNPNASPEDIQREFDKCDSLNCAEHTFFTLTRNDARTKEGLSPRSYLEQKTKEFWNKNPEALKDAPDRENYLPLGEVLGLKHPDRSLDDKPQTYIPRNTTVFLQSPGYKPQSNRNQEFPFDHVFPSIGGTNAQKTFDHLNRPNPPTSLWENFSNFFKTQQSSIDNLEDIKKMGNYGQHRVIYSDLFAPKRAVIE